MTFSFNRLEFHRRNERISSRIRRSNLIFAQVRVLVHKDEEEEEKKKFNRSEKNQRISKSFSA